MKNLIFVLLVLPAVAACAPKYIPAGKPVVFGPPAYEFYCYRNQGDPLCP